MTPIKRFGILLVSFIFRISLFFGLTALALVLVFSDPNNLKQALNDTNTYFRFAESVASTAKDSQKSNPSEIPLDNPEVKSAITKALDNQSLKNISNTFIDSTYAWLNKTTSGVDFSVDVSQNKKVLGDNIAAFAVTRIQNLKPCISAPKNTGIFAIECNPAGLNLTELQAKFSNEIANDNMIFPDGKISSDILPKTSDGQKFTEKYSALPRYFGFFKLLPYALLSVSFICGLAVVLLSRTKREGVKRVGSALIASGIFMAISPLIYLYLLPLIGVHLPKFSSVDESMSNILNDLTSNLYSQLNVMLINIAIQAVVAGVTLLIITKFLKGNSNAYINLQRKSGVAVAESPISGNKRSYSDVPLQTSENNTKKKTKKVSSLQKKYRKM